MDIGGMAAKNFLRELYSMTSGDMGAQASMFDVGAAIGMDKASAGKTAEDLIGDGYVEVKTLSGGIGITQSGIEQVHADGGIASPAAEVLNLGSGPVLKEKGRQAVDAIAKEVQAYIASHHTAYDQLADMVIDLKTIDVQLLSSKPRTAVIREVLLSLHDAVKSTGNEQLSETIGKVLS